MNIVQCNLAKADPSPGLAKCSCSYRGKVKSTPSFGLGWEFDKRKTTITTNYQTAGTQYFGAITEDSAQFFCSGYRIGSVSQQHGKSVQEMVGRQ